MLVFGSAMLICVVSILILRSYSHRFGMVDHPGGRKQHALPTPTVGGLAMYFAAMLTVLFIASPITNHVQLLIGCAGLLMALGVLDDRHDLRVRVRMLIQMFLVLVVIMGADGTVTHLGAVFSQNDIRLGMLAVPFSVVAFVGGINAINMIDGVDGMAGSMTFITMLGVAVLSYLSGANDLFPLIFAMLGVLLGFLLFNTRIIVKRAWVFMGDSGSMWIGLVMGWFMAQVTHDKISAEPSLVLWLFGIPLIDTLIVIFRRVKNKRSPFKADRSHIHHRMKNLGFSTKTTVLLLSFVQAFIVGIGVIFYYTHTSSPIIFGCFVLLMAAYYIATDARGSVVYND
jgi:UDP-GlcNAc:undecaprenyl-phosphate GlcNAc-1-phosphate transferase